MRKEGIDLDKQDSLSYIQQALEKQSRLEELNRTAQETAADLEKAQTALETYKVRIDEEAQQAVSEQRKILEKRLEKNVQSCARKVERLEKKRVQEKDKQKKNHIDNATQKYRDRIKQVNRDIREEWKTNQVPWICRRKVWYSLFMPTFLKDYIFLVAAWLFTGLLIPLLIYFLIPDHRMWQFFILFPVFVVATVLAYIEIMKRTKSKYSEPLTRCREKYNELHELKGLIRKTEKNISKTEDESSYELKDMDDRIGKARQELQDARKEQADQLKEFEQTTRQSIISEFDEKSQGKLNELTDAMNRLLKEKNLTMEMASELQLELVDEYEDTLGAENMDQTKLNQLLQYLESGEAETLEESLKLIACPSGASGTDDSAD